MAGPIGCLTSASHRGARRAGEGRLRPGPRPSNTPRRPGGPPRPPRPERRARWRTYFPIMSPSRFTPSPSRELADGGVLQVKGMMETWQTPGRGSAFTVRLIPFRVMEPCEHGHGRDLVRHAEVDRARAPPAARHREHLSHPVHVPLHQVPAEPLAEGECALQVHAPAGLEAAEGGALEGGARRSARRIRPGGAPSPSGRRRRPATLSPSRESRSSTALARDAEAPARCRAPPRRRSLRPLR